MIYELQVDLEINVTKGNIEGITIMGERPSLGIDTLIAREEDRIMKAVQKDYDEDGLDRKIMAQESWYSYLDRIHNRRD